MLNVATSKSPTGGGSSTLGPSTRADPTAITPAPRANTAASGAVPDGPGLCRMQRTAPARRMSPVAATTWGCSRLQLA